MSKKITHAPTATPVAVASAAVHNVPTVEVRLMQSNRSLTVALALLHTVKGMATRDEEFLAGAVHEDDFVDEAYRAVQAAHDEIFWLTKELSAAVLRALAPTDDERALLDADAARQGAGAR